MTREESIELLRQVKQGDSEALDRLTSENMGLCKSIAARFIGRGCEYEDLVQIASIGMLKAIQSFDFSYNTAFSTYAVPLIIGEIRRFLRDDGTVKVGRSIKRLGGEAMRQREKFISENGREPRISELAGLCACTEGELIMSLDAACPVRSLSEPVGDGEDTRLGELIADRDDGISGLTDKIALAQAVKTLSKERRSIIYLRYFKELSQAQVGKLLGMTQVKVSREEKKIVAELKALLSGSN